MRTIKLILFALISGVLIGQYTHPIPNIDVYYPKTGSALPVPILSSKSALPLDFSDDDFGYIEEDREDMNKLVNHVINNRKDL